MEENIRKIEFAFSDSSEKVEFYVVEETKLNGIQYLLVTDSRDEEADAYILKEINDEGENILYEMVEDDKELEIIGSVFAELIEDIDII